MNYKHTVSVIAASKSQKQPFFIFVLHVLILIASSLVLSSCGNVSQAPLPYQETPSEPSLEPENTTKPMDRLFGAYTYGGIWQGMEPIYDLETTLGQRLDIVHWFMNWNNAWDSKLLATASKGGRLPMIAWEPVGKSVEAIASGVYDDYIISWAEGVKAHEGLVYLRPFAEMNGYWASWNGQPELFVKAWQHMVELFKLAGASNVRWVWAPNITDEPRINSNRMELYYPGEDYVDILALDGYNWGTTRKWTQWTSFEDLFAAPYERIAKLGKQPIWLAEVASTEEGGDKATWVREMFASSKFPRLEAMVWFNEDKETSWHINSSDTSLRAFQQSLQEGPVVASIHP